MTAIVLLHASNHTTIPSTFVCVEVLLYSNTTVATEPVLEEVGHDTHKRYSHMTLVCTSRSYALRRMQLRD